MHRPFPMNVLAAGLGVTAVIAQTILLREFLGVTDGNELVLGLVLGTWMLLTGAGAFLGRRSRAPAGRLRSGRFLWLGLLPLISVITLRVIRGTLFPAGVVPGFPETVFIAAAVLLPFCLLSGATFVRLARVITSRGGSVASAYGWEAAGSVLGGITGYLLTGSNLTNVEVLAGLGVFGTFLWLVAFAAGPRRVSGTRRMMTRVAAVLLPAVAIVLVAGPIDNALRELVLGDQRPVFAHDSPYGSLVVAERAGERSVFENGVLLSSSGDAVGREESVHFAMVQRRLPLRVLVVSGAAAGVLEEVFKYPVERVEYIDLNPGIRAAAPHLHPLPQDPRLVLAEGDVRAHLRSGAGPYDVILINTPDPSSAQTNRLFTREFFLLARGRMADSAVLSLSALPAVDYYGDRARLAASSIHATLQEVFPFVAVVPGERNYLLASAAPLDAGIARLVQYRGIMTTAVNRYYIDDDLLLERSRKFTDGLAPGAPVNTDLHPVVYFRQVAFWMESMGVSVEVVGWAALALTLAGLFLTSRVGGGVYAAGWAASGIEVIVLLGYQSLYGFVYQSLWLVIGAFMGGLAAGAAVSTRIRDKRTVWWFSGALALLGVCGILASVTLSALADRSGELIRGNAALLVLVAAAGGCTGLIFGAGSRLVGEDAGRTAGGLYAADLAGSAFGSFLTAVFLVPVIGTAPAALAVALLPLLYAVIWFRRSLGAAGKGGT